MTNEEKATPRKTTTAASSVIRDRIIELRRVPAKELQENPHNWRRHPKAQADALRGVLHEVGFADALIARETPGGLMLIDGHLRAELDPEMEVPVLVLDVDEAEATKLLATLDPLAAMAQSDQDALIELLNLVAFESDAVNAMLEALSNGETAPMPDFQPVGEEEQGRLDEKAKVTCPECGCEFTP